ncbi:MAG: HAD family phosphatase [Bacteroidota bacterium]|nr:HAD family phosphatase [Bacteroidota bacterium]
MIQAVLFDLDGVIADTLHYHYLAWAHMFEKLGGTISKESVFLHEGRTSREILPIFLREAGVTLENGAHEEFIERKRRYYRSIVRIRYFPYAFETVEEIRRRGFRTALVTASSRRNMEKSIDPDRRSLFDAIVTGDDVSQAKPSPEPYLAAARQVGVPPANCLVVENAPLGIASARNAGMTCVAVVTTLPIEHLREADIVIGEIRDLLELPPLIARRTSHGTP